MRNLILVFGDQLDADSAVFREFDPSRDAIWMAEVAEENTHVWCHKQRITFFLSAMRHFRDAMRERGSSVHYHELTDDQSADRGGSLAELLTQDLKALAPEEVLAVEAGDFRVDQSIRAVLDDSGIAYEILADDHFYCSRSQFAEWAEGKKSLVLEFFYRWIRKQHDVLLDEAQQPEGGQWNFDRDNRVGFGKQGPKDLKPALTFRPDAVTQDVMRMVQKRFSDHPGVLESFAMPVTAEDAKRLLSNFVTNHLADFGTHQDAMWAGEPFLNHSRLSAVLNVKLLNPRECVGKAIEAWQQGHAPLNSVEGFVRQIVGWREFVRGIYFLKMPEYAGLNYLEHSRPVPSFFWDGNTQMNCVRNAMASVLQHSYSHHIERLMVLGNFAQLWGTDPRLFHEWHMAMYADAVDWVSLPNALGMSQFADGGVVGTKPYCSSGNYINKMSNYCGDCRYNYRERSGPDACPFTTLYWDFLDRHADRLKDNGRMKFAFSNLQKLQKKSAEMRAVRERAAELFESGEI